MYYAPFCLLAAGSWLIIDLQNGIKIAPFLSVINRLLFISSKYHQQNVSISYAMIGWGLITHFNSFQWNVITTNRISKSLKYFDIPLTWDDRWVHRHWRPIIQHWHLQSHEICLSGRNLRLRLIDTELCVYTYIFLSWKTILIAALSS